MVCRFEAMWGHDGFSVHSQSGLTGLVSTSRLQIPFIEVKIMAVHLDFTVLQVGRFGALRGLRRIFMRRAQIALIFHRLFR